MRYASIRSMDISNGERVGISLFVQGCRFCCSNCFNKDTWDFNGGNEWTPEVEDKFIELASRPYIKRISILGGEPLADENLDGILNLVNRFRLLMPEKTIWLYTGYKFMIDIPKSHQQENVVFSVFPNVLSQGILPNEEYYKQRIFDDKRMEIISKCNVLVDGRYVDSLRDVSLRWRGSSNQRCIDIQKSLQQGKVVLYCD